MWYQLCNVGTVVLSAAVLAFAVIARSQCDTYHVFLDNYAAVIDLLIFFSAVQIIIAGLKCCRMFREDICSSTILTVLMATLNIIGMCICVALWRHEHPVFLLQKSILRHNFNSFYKGEVLKDWDTLQFQFECCGAKNYTDWNGRVPQSCCKRSDTSTFECTPQNVYKAGCLKNLNDPIRIKEYHMSWEICLGLSMINLIIEYLSCYLRQSRNSDYHTLD